MNETSGNNTEPEINPQHTFRLRDGLLRISIYSNRILFGISFLVMLLIVAEYGFFLPDSFEDAINVIVLVVIWFFVIDYTISLASAIVTAISLRTVYFLRFHFRKKWINLVLTLSIFAQNAVFFNWFDSPYLTHWLHTIDYRLYTQIYIAVTQLSIAFGFFIQFTRYSARIASFKFHPAQSFVLSFVLLIIIGAGLLMMPKASMPGTTLSFVDALFTSASAVCVTGLTVVDTGAHFTVTGQLIILFLIQIGGLGFITFATFFAMYFGEGISLRERILVKDVLNETSYDEALKTLKQIFFITMMCEWIGAALLYYFFNENEVLWNGSAFFYAIFHAVSAFCNAGFSLWPDSVSRLGWNSKIVMITLIIIGGLGFSVIRNIFSVAFNKLFSRIEAQWILWKNRIWTMITIQSRVLTNDKNRRPKEELSAYRVLRSIMESHHRELSIQTKFVLTVTFSLILLGSVLFAGIEWHHSLSERPTTDKILESIFQSVSARTAGFNTFDMSAFTVPALLLIIFLMFIGASPGSTGGGIKTTTFGIMLLSSFGNLQGKDRIRLFGRTIPAVNIVRALMVISFSFITVFMAIFLLSITDPDKPILDIVFETVSAFATVGLSRGTTIGLSVSGKMILIACMFIGRVGTVSVALAVASNRKQDIEEPLPEESMMIG